MAFPFLSGEEVASPMLGLTQKHLLQRAECFSSESDCLIFFSSVFFSAASHVEQAALKLPSGVLGFPASTTRTYAEVGVSITLPLSAYRHTNSCL